MSSISDCFCSPFCLLGIKNGGIPDPLCPNAPLHVLGQYSKLDLLTSHIVQTIHLHAETHMEQIHRSEAKSTAVYRMTLPLTGFTFTLKAAWDQAIPHQQREYCFYEHMQSLQGSCIPICLGEFIIPLNSSFAPVDTHFMVLSSAGVAVTEGIIDGSNKDRARPIYWRTANEILRSSGVVHNATEWKNVFYNHAINDFMLVDFSQACFAN